MDASKDCTPRAISVRTTPKYGAWWRIEVIIIIIKRQNFSIISGHKKVCHFYFCFFYNLLKKIIKIKTIFSTQIIISAYISFGVIYIFRKNCSALFLPLSTLIHSLSPLQKIYTVHSKRERQNQLKIKHFSILYCALKRIRKIG
jgi:hypothetical protein